VRARVARDEAGRIDYVLAMEPLVETMLAETRKGDTP
jgi:hypothetical protein